MGNRTTRVRVAVIERFASLTPSGLDIDGVNRLPRQRRHAQRHIMTREANIELWQTPTARRTSASKRRAAVGEKCPSIA